VESPTKARTIHNILRQSVHVVATMGHIRDLPQNEFGVDIQHGFQPTYKILPGKHKIASQLRQLAKQYPNIYLATDEDREGEAIAWHAAVVMNKKEEEVKRVVFHEITPEAVKSAFLSPRTISRALVDAQQARRILDRVVGYTLSPFVSNYLTRGLSAGRVQSVALRLIVEREKEIESFQPQNYWKIRARVERENLVFFLELVSRDGEKLPALAFQTQESVEEVLSELGKGSLVLAEKNESQRQVPPPPPYITSTLQQEASTALGFSATKTMQIAQQLYEGIPLGLTGTIGLITYMRTDSPSVAQVAQKEARDFIVESYGSEYVPSRPPVYQARQPAAQEAHEAIRPTSVHRTPEKVKFYLSQSQLKLYELIWKRFLASQMKSAETRHIRITAVNGRYDFEAEQVRVIFPGFTVVYPTRIERGDDWPADLKPEQVLSPVEYVAEATQTKPPPRYTEATLIRTLEKFGIGRPSTYAPILATLLDRRYVRRQKRTLIPEKMGCAVIELLTKFFPDVIDVEFTARMEDQLDRVAAGEIDWLTMLTNFYQAYKPVLDKAYSHSQEIREFLSKYLAEGQRCPRCGAPLVLRKSQYGIFLGCSQFPKCRFVQSKNGQSSTSSCPKCGSDLVLRKGRYGQFLACSAYPRCRYTRKLTSHAHHSGHRPEAEPDRAAPPGKV
ncbi:MAG TPA: type I DNA topoisomerase, partial [bacterium]|nr:type I DNA topoisomerase [bacterium]